MQTLDQHRLKSLLHYDPATGAWYWLPRSDRSRSWNRKHAGHRAGYLLDGPEGTDGYEKIGVDGVNYYAHRLAWLYMTGEVLPSHIEVDHKNRHRSDNRWENLRKATKGQNGQNRDIQKNNTSGVKGVSWDKSRSKWTASITVGSDQTNLGRFDTKEEAIAAREAAERRLHGEFAVIKGAA